MVIKFSDSHIFRTFSFFISEFSTKRFFASKTSFMSKITKMICLSHPVSWQRTKNKFEILKCHPEIFGKIFYFVIVFHAEITIMPRGRLATLPACSITDRLQTVFKNQQNCLIDFLISFRDFFRRFSKIVLLTYPNYTALCIPRICPTNQSSSLIQSILTVDTLFENDRKSLIQHCERSELLLHFEWTKNVPIW